MATKQTFETALLKLEEIVKEMESSDLPIEEAMKKFEEGIRLSRFCTEKLDDIERRITVITEDAAGGVGEKPFLPEDGDMSNQE